jgi:hypothetical protein
MHAQFHDEISVFSYSPGGFVLKSCFRGSERTGYGYSGFLRPDEGLPPGFSRFLSCSWRADHGIPVDGRPWTHLQCIFGVVEKKAGKEFHRPAIVHKPLKGGKISPFQPDGNDTFLPRFPQAGTGLSKPNLVKCFSCVNLPWHISAFSLFDPSESSVNDGNNSIQDFWKNR